MNNLELYHHGIKGMKWGIRRYQNKDGSLTAAGRKRYSDPSDDSGTESEKVSGSGHSSKPKKKSLSEMSDEEIREKIKRLELEKRYSELSPKQVNKGKDLAKKILERSTENIGTQLATYAMGAGVNYIAKSLGYKNSTKKVVGEDGIEKFVDVFEDIVNPRKGQKDK